MAAILGGGLGGLTTAFYLVKNEVNLCMKVFLLESSNSCGGWIKSIRTSNYIFEQGPRTIRPKGDNALHTLNMISELRLSEYVSPVLPNHPAAKNRMICVNNKLHTLPSRFSDIFIPTEPFKKPLIYALFKDLNQPHTSLPDDTIYNFTERRFGREVADYVISPMICGICAGDAKEISVKFLLKSLFDHEQNHGSVVKGMVKSMFHVPTEKDIIPLSDLALRAKEEKWSVYTLKGGLAILPEALVQRLKDDNVPIHYNSKVEKIEFIDSCNVKLHGKFDLSNTIETNFVYSALPSYKLATLVQEQHPELSNDLSQIPFVNVGIINLYYEDDHLATPGFGFLVPPIEKSKILGVVYDSCCIPDQKGTVLTVMTGGKWFNERLGENPSKDELLHVALQSVKNTLNISHDPVAHNVSILKNCIPQYKVGHHERVNKIRKYIKDNGLPLALIGSSYDGVGVNDVVASAKTQVEQHNYSWNI